MQSQNGIPAVSLTTHQRVSYLQPGAGQKSALLYVGDWSTNDVDVYDFPSGTYVGTLTGVSAPYGMCVDAKGDIYIAGFGGGNVVEYAHGGLSPVRTYSSGGEPVGCAVDAKGDLAVTSFSPGDVVVFAEGDPSKGTSYSGPCEWLWTMGYDDKGNLVGIGEESTGTIVACALLSGSKTMTVLSGCCSSSDPIIIGYPGGSMWDGKYLGLSDQEAGGTFKASIIRTTILGTTLIPKGKTVLGPSCNHGYADVVNPFILGERNTPVNHRQAEVVVGIDLGCGDPIALWHYPVGNLLTRLTLDVSEPYGVGVSLKN